jgi:hypothetical protein
MMALVHLANARERRWLWKGFGKGRRMPSDCNSVLFIWWVLLAIFWVNQILNNSFDGNELPLSGFRACSCPQRFWTSWTVQLCCDVVFQVGKVLNRYVSVEDRTIFGKDGFLDGRIAKQTERWSACGDEATGSGNLTRVCQVRLEYVEIKSITSKSVDQKTQHVMTSNWRLSSIWEKISPDLFTEPFDKIWVSCDANLCQQDIRSSLSSSCCVKGHVT